jgi:hypothetical protein
MILWVKKESIGADCDQRVRVDRVEGRKIFTTLEGTGESAIIMTDEIVGLEISETLTIWFDVTKSRVSG